MPSFIKFEYDGDSETGKTGIWRVVPVDDAGAVVLGYVRWFGRWRRYSFFPHAGTVYESVCLRDLAAFCDQETNKHRLHRRSVRRAAALAGEAAR